MKKLTQYSLPLVTCAFVIFISGLFVGRNTGYQLSNDAPGVSESTIADHTEIYSDEVYIDGKMNINAARKEDLVLLPGIGDVLSQRIVDYREENGMFAEIDDLLLVDGMGNAKLSRIREYITVGGS